MAAKRNHSFESPLSLLETPTPATSNSGSDLDLAQERNW